MLTDAGTSNARMTSGKEIFVPFGYCSCKLGAQGFWEIRANKLVAKGLWGGARGRCGPKYSGDWDKYCVRPHLDMHVRGVYTVLL